MIIILRTSKKGPPNLQKLPYVMPHATLLRRLRVRQVLAAAPSNTGADVLCAKLAKLGLAAWAFQAWPRSGWGLGTQNFQKAFD